MGTILSSITGRSTLATEKSPFRNMRVTIVVNSVEMGGVEEHVRQVATGLLQRDARVTVVVPEESAIDPLAQALSVAGVAVERLTLSRGMLRPAGLRRLGRLVWLLRARHTETVHLHLVGYEGGRWALLGAALARVPAIVCTIHVAPQEPQPWKARLGRALLTPFVDRYIAVSQASRDRLGKYPGVPSARPGGGPDALELPRLPAPPGPGPPAAARQRGRPPPPPG